MKNFSPLAIVEDNKKDDLAYPWVKTDSGREFSNTPKQKNDCTTRALSTVLDIDYQTIEDFLRPYGKEYGKGLDNDTFKELMGKEIFGYSFRWIYFAPIKGQARMNPVSFCLNYPSGVFIANMAGHVCAFIDGVLYDEFPRAVNSCVYGVWEVTKIKGEN
jgi:hypothetical protein